MESQICDKLVYFLWKFFNEVDLSGVLRIESDAVYGWILAFCLDGVMKDYLSIPEEGKWGHPSALFEELGVIHYQLTIIILKSLLIL